MKAIQIIISLILSGFIAQTGSAQRVVDWINEDAGLDIFSVSLNYRITTNK
jgi:hypothetical protein